MQENRGEGKKKQKKNEKPLKTSGFGGFLAFWRVFGSRISMISFVCFYFRQVSEAAESGEGLWLIPLVVVFFGGGNQPMDCWGTQEPMGILWIFMVF